MYVVGRGAFWRAFPASSFSTQYIVDDFSTIDAVAIAARGRVPDLLLLASAGVAQDDRRLVRQVRAKPWPLASVPLLGLSMRTSDAAVLRRCGLDAIVPEPQDPAALAAMIVPWNPLGVTAGVGRLATVFGASEIDALVARFETLLASAVAALDQRVDPAIAHRIAGIAGTLGFERVGESWLALSEGDVTVRDDARRTARVALHAIARGRHERDLY